MFARLVIVGLAAVVTALASAPDGLGHRPKCPTRTPYPVGDARRVYAIPHGCTWVAQPRARQVAPVVKTRIHGVTRSYRLTHAPLGDAAGMCGVAGFIVQWPLFVVATDSVWIRRQDRNECVSSFDAAPTWIYRFTATQPRRVFTSPTYRAGG